MQNKNFWEACVGKTIDDRYSLEKLIGSGSFGGVFQAKMIVLGHTLQKQVAVKLMQDGGVGGMQHCELKSALSLPSHDSLIQHFNWGQVKINDFPMLYLVMELGEYCLDSYRKDRQVLSSDEVKEIVLSVAEGLCYMHSKVHGGSELTPPEQLTHRDLKPANVIKVGKKWKMADFGFAKFLNKGSVQATLIGGTDRYMPPEIFERQWISTKGDIWALGVMIVEMLAGHHPIKDPITSTNIQKEPIDLDGVPDEWIEIANGCLQKNHIERWTAQQILDALKSLDKIFSAEDLFNQAYEQQSHGDYEIAISKYTEAIQLKPDYIIAYAGRARAFKLINDETNAKKDLKKAIALFPISTAEAYHGRAIAKSGLDDKQGAIDDLTKAIEINPNYVAAYRARGIIMNELGDTDKAISDYNEAIRINPNYADVYYELGKIKLKKEDEIGATAAYTNAMRLKPNYAKAYVERGNIRLKSGASQSAISDYSKAIDIRPSYTVAYLNRGIVYQHLKQKKEALTDFREAARLYQLQGKIDDYNDVLSRIKKLEG
ncbi:MULTISPECIES: protein kinase family protein [Pseudanabaena]|jgi:serine/threonine protein kinase|uniref:protein kinase family protein n=1 Tax=Pseudanabaena TaxID=1152 RepID=UPI002479C673|nr:MULTISPECIES: protein kinase family protein [Pseudanabaena]MEA5488659.1 protein kinase family protein [Pseudanabaena sp. CCNP1317]WGS72126.1 tetratricopeptide repeat-containing serine/threonine-protein kinase [Pseudanabaena galeata CCNP1313]